MQKRIVAMLLALVMVMTLLPMSIWAEETDPVGSVANPADLMIGENTATLEAGDADGYTYAYTANEDGILTVLMPRGSWKYSIHNVTTDESVGPFTSNDDVVVAVGTMELAAGDVVHVNVSTYNPGNPNVAPAGIVPFTATFPYPLGDWVNPAPLNLGGNTANIPEGSAGYYFTWTAEEDGNLNITMPEITEESTIPGWYYSLSNITQDHYGDYFYSDTDSNTAVLEVAAGDEIELIVGTYDPADVMLAPAGTVTVDAIFTYLQGSSNSPIALSEDAVVTIPAGKTMYFTGRFGGQSMTAVGAGVSITHNNKTYDLTDEETTFPCYQKDFYNPCLFVMTNTTDADVDVSLTIRIPVGIRENPVELKMGENLAKITEGNEQGYYFTFTAEQAGQLQLTMPSGNWQYVIHNLTSGKYGSNHTSGDDPVENPAITEVKAGNQLQIIINSFDPADVNHYPAANLRFQASFQAEGGSAPHTHEYSYADNGDGTHTATCSCTDSYTEDHAYNGGLCACGAIEASNDAITGSNVATTAGVPVTVVYTTKTKGTLSVTISGNPGYNISVTAPTGEAVGLPRTSKQEKTYTYELTTAGDYTITMQAYDAAAWEEADGTISYYITFTPVGTGGDVERKAYEISETALVLGDNSLTLLETAVTTIYVFKPTEMGVYTFTAPDGTILGYWGAGKWLLSDPQATTNTYEWTCTGVGQSAYIGVSGAEGTFKLNIAKTGDYNPIVYTEVEYVNKAELAPYEVPACAVLGEYVDVSKAHTAVLGADGYYHLDSAEGDILLLDLNHQDIVLSNKLNSDIPTMYLYTNELLDDGSYIKYDIRYAIAKNDKDGKLSYEEVMSADGYYPLTEDLIRFYKEYATEQGVWSFYLPGTEYDEDTVWMYCCRTMMLDHTYENGVCTGCGEADPNAVALIKWAGVQVQANANLNMQFALKASDFEGLTGNYVVLTRHYADGKTAEVRIEQADWTFNKNVYIVTYSGIAAKEMGDTIEAVVYNAEGKPISEVRSESIESYAKAMLKRDNVIANAAQRTMFVDLLNYGAAAQTNFGYNTANLANAGLSDEEKSWATQEDVVVTDNSVLNGAKQQLVLKNVVQLQVALKGVSIEGLTAKATYINYNGKVMDVDLTVEESGGYCVLSLNNLSFADYRTLVTFTAYNADGTVAGTAVTSMESYSFKANNNENEDLAELSKALMKFSASAYAFFTQQNG